MSGKDKQKTEDEKINVLNVGTKILTKDLMDQLIRKIGPFRTYYAANIDWAKRAFKERSYGVLIAEAELDDGSVYRLWKELGFSDFETFFLLAVPAESPEFNALAEEMGANALLIKPINGTQLSEKMKLYANWQAHKKMPYRSVLYEAELCLRAHKWREVEEKLARALEIAPEQAQVQYRAGCYQVMRDPKKAEEHLTKALTLRANHIPTMDTLGHLYLEMGELDKGEALLRKALKLSPLNPDRIMTISRLYFLRAEEACKNAIKIDSNNSAIRLLLGKVLLMKRDYLASIHELDLALKQMGDTGRTEAKGLSTLAKKLGGINQG